MMSEINTKDNDATIKVEDAITDTNNLNIVIVEDKKDLKKNKPSGHMYFSAETQVAIVQFRKLEQQKERDVLYKNEIFPAFSQLVENLIFMYGFGGKEPYDSLKSDCITFLYEKLHRFDELRGPKAFSYFNVVAKNWLIIRSKSSLASQRKHISIDDASVSSRSESAVINNAGTVDEPERQLTIKQGAGDILKLLTEIKTRLSSQYELRCIDAIISLFVNVEDIDLLNKRAVFVYLRELSGLEPKKMTVAMSSIRKHYSALSRSDEFSIF